MELGMSICNYFDVYRTWVRSLTGLVYDPLTHSGCWNFNDVTDADAKIASKIEEKLPNKLLRVVYISKNCQIYSKVSVSRIFLF